MVSMAPNSQRYDYTYRYTELCNKKKKEDEEGGDTIYDLIKASPRFSKTFSMIEMALLKNYLKSGGDGYTMFIVEDKDIPDSWMSELDTFKAQNFLNSYIVPGEADREYLIKNGSSVYIPRKYHYNNPLLILVKGDELLVNKVGKAIEQIKASNGYIHVLDNIAEVSYIN
jgi:uncharacterized surface protein with fasciclin (FAS1) repeats